MSTIKAKDGTQIYYKDWAREKPSSLLTLRLVMHYPT
jgi:hypothetical protein